MRISLILVLASFWHMGKSNIPLCTLDQEWKSNGFYQKIGYPTKSDDSEFKFIFKTEVEGDDNCMIKVKQNDKNISFNLTNYPIYSGNRKVVYLQHELSLTEGQVTFEFAKNVTRQLYLYFQNPILQENPFLLDLVDKGENFSLPMTERFSQCLDFRETYDESFEDPRKFSFNLNNASKVIKVNVENMTILVQMNINYPIDEIFTITCNFMKDININEALKVKFLYPINKKKNEVQIVENIIYKGDNFSVLMTNRFSQCLDFSNTVYNESFEETLVTDCSYGNDTKNACKVIGVNRGNTTLLIQMNIDYLVDEMLILTCKFNPNIKAVLMVQFPHVVNGSQIQLEKISPQLAISGVLLAMMVIMVVIYFKLNKKKKCNQLVQVNSFNPSTLLYVESREDSESEEEESTGVTSATNLCLLKLEGFSEDIIKSQSDIVKGDFLGEGAFGQVYSGFLNIGGTTR
jgi:hypothetical protein